MFPLAIYTIRCVIDLVKQKLNYTIYGSGGQNIPLTLKLQIRLFIERFSIMSKYSTSFSSNTDLAGFSFSPREK